MQYYQRNGFGRYWTASALGIQNMSRKIRHTLACVKKPCMISTRRMPTLHYYPGTATDNGINCAGLDAYIANREEYLADWMVYKGNVRDEAKAHLLAIINGRRVKLTPKDPKWYQEFYNG